MRRKPLNRRINYDSYRLMFRNEPSTRLPRNRRGDTLALILLLAMGGLALAGPSSLLAWSENLATLAQRKAEIARLQAERDELRNRVALLNPKAADPDLVGELLRSNLNVVHPDEVVMTLN